jgi:hypothetical protein
MLVDALEESQRLVVIAHGGALESLQRQAVTYQSLLTLTLSPELGLLEVINSRIVHKRLVLFVEFEGQTILIVRTGGSTILLVGLIELTLVGFDNLGRLVDGFVDLTERSGKTHILGT